MFKRAVINHLCVTAFVPQIYGLEKPKCVFKCTELFVSEKGKHHSSSVAESCYLGEAGSALWLSKHSVISPLDMIPLIKLQLGSLVLQSRIQLCTWSLMACLQLSIDTMTTLLLHSPRSRRYRIKVPGVKWNRWSTCHNFIIPFWLNLNEIQTIKLFSQEFWGTSKRKSIFIKTIPKLTIQNHSIYKYRFHSDG